MSIAKRIKNHKDYAVRDGQDIGIECGETADENINNLKPALKPVLVNGGNSEIKWMQKNTDGIAIYVNRNNSTWEFFNHKYKLYRQPCISLQ